MSHPCESKYAVCEIVGCDEVPSSYAHEDEMYCPEHEEEYERFVQFMDRFQDEQQRGERP